MNGSTENRAPGASERSGGKGGVLTWVAASRMLPLVQRVVADVLACQGRLDRLQPEKDRLDSRRRTLAWPERARRYHLQEDIAGDERQLREALGELDALGVILLDPLTGQVGFPTLVNKRRAFFSWVPGEQTLAFWHYADDGERRPIPSAWTRADGRRKA
jgi:hypothetical protein